MSASGSHLSKELFNLVKAIGECRSKQEEDRIIVKEVESLKAKIGLPGVSAKDMKEYLIRAIYIEMLGHDASFAYIHSINLAQSNKLQSKRVGYLTASLCLSPESQMLILLVATLQRDLKSPNYLERAAALIAISKLVNPGLVHALLDPVVHLLSDENEVVRKKAVMVLHKFIRLTPDMATEYSQRFKAALCDRDPSVMAASLNYFYDMLKNEANRPYFKDLIPSFVVILKQVIDHRLPRDYDYHRMPAPWIQIKILEILGFLGADDQRASEQMYEILTEVMRRADDLGINIGYAIVYQCLMTITQIYPKPNLIEMAAQSISRFLISESYNLKYTGITGLASIIKIDSSYVAQHQMTVVDCLEDNDETIKRKTLSLLYRMTNSQNVKVIVDKLMAFLKSTTLDTYLKADLVSKITELAERFAPDNHWYVEIMSETISIAGSQVSKEILNNYIRLLLESAEDEDFKAFAAEHHLERLCDKESCDPVVQISSWVLGEFGSSLPRARQDEATQVICSQLFRQFEDDMTKGWLLTAAMKLAGNELSDDLRHTVSRLSMSKNENIEQRCYEFAGITMKIGHNINLKGNLNLEIDPTLTFLDRYVQEQLTQGANPYDPERSRKNMSFLMKKSPNEDYKASDAFQSLRLEAYDAPRRENPSAFLATSPVIVNSQPSTVDSSELHVRKNVWSKEGYTGDKVEKPAEPEPTSYMPSRTFNSEPAYQQPIRKPAPVVQKSSKDIEKERFAASLFGATQVQPTQPAVPVRSAVPQAPQRQDPQKREPTNLLDL
eukprot:CAMPEP_0204903846 /NCGR_PEP_ID=MMETSP1397-20131031/4513_1 /ASSEMBLY_ACC=CAM_ASM_000891 /TAXON_ID=49980 /ORGANISM="Climacostomum Climacostomum virens, Strain Stock W-24" /LENGTH=781 /DNA_ID=CAMNT_0052072551 /DNA_START=1123 /DNA_END=3468 /DNA_ORIENTATION=+